MSEQNWTMVNGVKVNTEILEEIARRGLEIEFDEETGYPWVVRRPGDPSSPAKSKRVQFLHLFVWAQIFGAIRDPDQVIHHKNHDKLDARIKNLSIGTVREHAKSHARKRRRYSPRKRTSFGGFRFRPPLPAKVSNRPDLIGQIFPSRERAARPRSLSQQVRDLEELLGRNFPLVAQGTHYLRQNGKPIPRGASVRAWRQSETRRLGLRLPRLACTEAEACFVMLYAFHRLNLDEVAEDLREPVELLRTLLKRVSVNEAIIRWVHYGRLPEKTVKRGGEEVKIRPRA